MYSTRCIRRRRTTSRIWPSVTSEQIAEEDIGNAIEQRLAATASARRPACLRSSGRTACNSSASCTGPVWRVSWSSSSDTHPDLLRYITDDELLTSLLIANGLHPDDVARADRRERSTRCDRSSPATEVTSNCSTSTNVSAQCVFACSGAATVARRRRCTLRNSVERAIVEAAPEITIIDVEEPADAGVSTPIVLGSQTQRCLRSGDGMRCHVRNGRDPVVSAPQPLSAVLKRIRDMPLQPKPRPGERCELCAELIPDEHGHVVDLESRALMCACRPCYLVFAPQGAGGTRFRAVPDRFVSFPDFALSSAAMGCVANTGRRRVLLHQLLAGPSRRVLPAARPERPSRCCRSTAWDEIVEANPGPGRPCCPTSRRSWFAVPIGNHERQQRKRSATWFRSTSATSSSVSFAGCGRDSTGAPRRTPRSMRSSTAFGRRRPIRAIARGCPTMSPVSFEVIGARVEAVRRRADAGVASANHRGRRNARARHRTSQPDHDRAETTSLPA